MHAGAHVKSRAGLGDVTGPLQLKDKVVKALASIHSDRPSSCFSELQCICPRELQQLGVNGDEADFARELKKLCIRNRVAFTKKFHDAMITRGHPGTSRPAPRPAPPSQTSGTVALDPADWEVPVAEQPKDGVCSVSMHPAAAIAGLRERPVQAVPQAYVALGAVEDFPDKCKPQAIILPVLFRPPGADTQIRQFRRACISR